METLITNSYGSVFGELYIKGIEHLATEYANYLRLEGYTEEQIEEELNRGFCVSPVSFDTATIDLPRGE